MNPLVTIAVPTYERVEYLQEAVASGLAQTHGAIEVLISDDGTTAEIPRWSEEMARKDGRVRFQKNARNLGLAGNWNACVNAARGEFITIIGDDDRLLPDFAARLVNAIGEASVAFANHYLIDSAGKRMEAESREHTARYQRDRMPAGKLEHAETWVWRNSVPMSAALIRTAEAKRFQFREELNTPEIEFFLRMARNGGRFVFVPEYLSEYRVHAQSATGSGLRSEALADCLLPMKAEGETEEARKEFLSPLLADAAGRCLARGDVERARTYLENPYYRANGAKAEFQRFCAAIPGGTWVYRMGKKLKG